VPVSGDVSNPDFELGSIITKALLNAITKIVTSPFTLLAGLVGSEEDLQRLNFTPGTANLSDQNRQKLDALVSALNQRPNLSLVITGRVNLEADRKRLQKNALKQQLLDAGLTTEEIEEKGEEWEEAIAERYRELPASASEAEAGSARKQYIKVYESIEVPDDELQTLAQQRAVAIKGYLVNEAGLAPDRAVVGQIKIDGKDSTFSGVTLEIDS